MFLVKLNEIILRVKRETGLTFISKQDISGSLERYRLRFGTKDKSVVILDFEVSAGGIYSRFKDFNIGTIYHTTGPNEINEWLHSDPKLVKLRREIVEYAFIHSDLLGYQVTDAGEWGFSSDTVKRKLFVESDGHRIQKELVVRFHSESTQVIRATIDGEADNVFLDYCVKRR